MCATTPENLIGADGGGTACRIALIWQGRQFETRVGAANASTDLEGAAATIRTGLADLADKAGQDPGALVSVPAYLGLAGVISDDIADKLAARLPLRNVELADDRHAALAGALGDRDGTVVGIGTGSFLARRVRGTVRLIGGYGPQLGDEASGAWLGRALLRRVLHCADGLTRHTGLTESTLAKFGGDTAAIVGFARTALPQDFGRYAPEITAAATAGDAAAVALMREGADYVARGLAALGRPPGEPVVLLGGVAQHYIPFLGDGIAGSLAPPRGTALDGALALAARRAAAPAGGPTT